MHFVSTIMLAVSANLDNLGVGISYGTRKIRLPFSANLIIALLTSAATLISMSFGSLLANYLTAQTANFMGSLIMAAAGLIIIWQNKKNNSHPAGISESSIVRSIKIHPLHVNTLNLVLREPHRADLDYSGHISHYEAVLLGLALAMSNLSTGFGAGIAGLDSFLTTVLVFTLSLITLWGGSQLGNRCASRWPGGRAAMVAGLLLLLIGIYEFFV